MLVDIDIITQKFNNLPVKKEKLRMYEIKRKRDELSEKSLKVMLRYSFLILKFDESWVSVGTVSLGIKTLL